MVIQKKDYVSIYKAEQKLADAGLRKQTVMGGRLRIDYFLQNLPLSGGNGKLQVLYQINGMKKEKSWEISFPAGKGELQLNRRIEEKEDVEKILDCRIFLPDDLAIRAKSDSVYSTPQEEKTEKLPGQEKERKITEEENVVKPEKTEKSRQEDQEHITEDSEKGRTSVMPENSRLSKNDRNEGLEQMPIVESQKNAENRPGNLPAENTIRKSQAVDIQKETREEPEQNEKIRYIQDLTLLLSMGEKPKELYYNSFLLHGYYQYRHVVAGKGFIGVPGNFSQREAIAAKMMGFPMFIEAENLQNCAFGEETREEMPQMGTYGYFLCKV